MSCCGDKRSAWRRSSARAAAAVRVPAGAPPAPERAGAVAGADGGEVALRFLGPASMLLRGPGSGRSYAVDPAAGSLRVDPRDVEALLATGLFQRIEG